MSDVTSTGASAWHSVFWSETVACWLIDWYDFDWRVGVVVRFPGMKRNDDEKTNCLLNSDKESTLYKLTSPGHGTLAWLMGGERSTCCWWCNMRAGGHWRPMEPPSPHSQSRLTSRPHTSSPTASQVLHMLLQFVGRIDGEPFCKNQWCPQVTWQWNLYSWWPKIVSGISYNIG